MRRMPKLFTNDLPGVLDWIKKYIAQEEQRTDMEPISAVGTRAFYYGTTPPDGWLLVNGAYVDRTTYAALYNVVGLAFDASPPAGMFKLPPAPTPESGGIWIIKARD